MQSAVQLPALAGLLHHNTPACFRCFIFGITPERFRSPTFAIVLTTKLPIFIFSNNDRS